MREREPHVSGSASATLDRPETGNPPRTLCAVRVVEVERSDPPSRSLEISLERPVELAFVMVEGVRFERPATEPEKPAEAASARDVLMDTVPLSISSLWNEETARQIVRAMEAFASPPTYSDADQERAIAAFHNVRDQTAYGEVIDAVAEALGMRRAG